MDHLRFWRAARVSLLAALAGCAGAGHAADPPAAHSMSPSDAQAFIAEVTRERGITVDRTAVTSMEQLFQTLGDDQIGRFASAEQLVAGKPGIEALTTHATIELAWSDDFTTFARILDELAKRADFAVKQLHTQRDAGRALTDAELKALEQNQKNAAFDTRAKLALSVLADEHLRIARGVVYETLRQFPKDPLTYRVAAYLSLLSREWPDFDAAMSWFTETEAKDAGLVYLRALEALNRRRVPKDATALLRECLRLNPKMVRAQAKLVLSEENVDATYREFQNLRAVAPQHPMVAIWGPAIISDYELSSAFREARAARTPPASIGTGTPAATDEDPPNAEAPPAP
jgi:hypothetical protein